MVLIEINFHVYINKCWPWAARDNTDGRTTIKRYFKSSSRFNDEDR